ncbi:glycosyltransferase [Clostridium sp. D43t1_170807_H7]|uniref:glycosyltransferase family 32 protein n=1 Tax=Clostridium sp. D43t1_170807_H7 TaxID=2787140 RepID=UPI00189B53C8|nr:glycosyltransferase [Clostridium sp. D43t1_170807_H7]
MSNIPKKIHYCWFGENELPELTQKCMESWRKNCLGYEIIEWNEKNFNINCNEYVKEAYQCKKWAFVSDYVRLKVLYEEGGIYVDTDLEIIKSFDDLLKLKSFIGFEDNQGLSTAVIGAVPKSNWIFKWMEYYETNNFIKQDGSMDTTTNVEIISKMLTKTTNLEFNNTMQILNNGIKVFPKEYFSPKEYATNIMKITNNTYAIHHFDSSWLGELEIKKLRRGFKLRKIFGNTFGKISNNIIYGFEKYGILGPLKVFVEFKKRKKEKYV